MCSSCKCDDLFTPVPLGQPCFINIGLVHKHNYKLDISGVYECLQSIQHAVNTAHRSAKCRGSSFLSTFETLAVCITEFQNSDGQKVHFHTS